MLIALRLLIVVSIAGPYFLYRLGAEKEVEGEASQAQEVQILRDQALVSLVLVACAQTLVYIACLKLMARRATLHAYLQFSATLR